MESERKTTKSRLGAGLFFAGVAAGILGIGCLTRPVAQLEPTTKANFTAVVKQQAIDKVDLLFAIDNSASMGDKQDLFKDAVPDLISRLLTPDCVDNPTKVTQRQKQNPDGSCPNGLKLEFQPVHDLHVGIVTSALGGGGSPDICDGSGGVPTGVTRHDNDKGELINRTKPNGGGEGTVNNAKPVDGNGGNFLAWLPASEPKNQGKPAPNVTPEPSVTQLQTDFQSLVVGVQEYGCGLEAQLESWYRFLVQPDPWDDIPKSAGGAAAVALTGVDAKLLKQRKDFLRDDSLVSIIMLTDEEDSWSDPLALGGRGWVTRTQNFPSTQAKQAGTMPRGTSECAEPIDVNNPTTTGPNNKDCTSCGFQGNKPGGSPIASDPECQKSCGANCLGFYTSAEDNLNVRYTNDMKRKYGFDPQFPVQRYVDGLKSLKVPNQDGEHKGGGGGYLGTKNCTNPLFARDLPDGSDTSSETLCNLKVGSRTPDLVFFAIIGGVPWQLLVEDGSNNKSPFKAALTNDDWTKIIGKDPSTYQTDGIDPHMIESVAPRAGLPGTTASNTADPIHGREWKTSLAQVGLDLQYACTFTLPTPKDCTLPQNEKACDCVGSATGPEGSPLCNGTTQVRGKAYPTIRELRVAKAMGGQGIVSSLCARNVTDKNADDYGYRPAVTAIVDRLKAVLAGQCLPQKLVPANDGTVPCLVLISFQPGADQNTVCDASKGLKQPDPDVLKRFQESKLAELKQQDPKATAADVGPACELTQLDPSKLVNGTCETITDPGWCYVSGAAAGTCAQAIKFSATGQPASGTSVSLQCIEVVSGQDAGGGGG